MNINNKINNYKIIKIFNKLINSKFNGRVNNNYKIMNLFMINNKFN